MLQKLVATRRGTAEPVHRPSAACCIALLSRGDGANPEKSEHKFSLHMSLCGLLLKAPKPYIEFFRSLRSLRRLLFEPHRLSPIPSTGDYRVVRVIRGPLRWQIRNPKLEI